MSRSNQLAERFLAAKPSSLEQQKITPPSPFRSLFATDKLKSADVDLLESFLPQDALGRDHHLEELCRLTIELRSIRRQLVFLVGERLSRAKVILSQSIDKGSFGKWIDQTGLSRKSAYNALALYQLYCQMPSEDLKNRLKELPVKITYRLACRQGELNAKIAFIEQVFNEGERDLLRRLEERFPLNSGDKRSSPPKERISKTLKEIISDIKRLALSDRLDLSKSTEKEAVLLLEKALALITKGRKEK